MTGDAELLLARADKLLDSPDRTVVGNSARLAAFLARQAVEDLIDARCAVLTGVQVVVGTAKAKLAVLKSLDTTPAGPTLIDAWHQLTTFCHHHAYQLSPTVAEVRAQCAAVERECLGGASESSTEKPAGATVSACPPRSSAPSSPPSRSARMGSTSSPPRSTGGAVTP